MEKYAYISQTIAVGHKRLHLVAANQKKFQRIIIVQFDMVLDFVRSRNLILIILCI